MKVSAKLVEQNEKKKEKKREITRSVFNINTRTYGNAIGTHSQICRGCEYLLVRSTKMSG